MRRGVIYALLALAVLALAVVPIGTAVFVLGFGYGDSPCVMCWEQRIGMALIALIGLFVLRYGPKPKYVGLAVFVGAWGMHMGLRHVGMHAARDVGQGFSVMILGAHTYTWSLFIFWVTVVTLALLLMLARDGDVPSSPRKLGPLGSLAMVVFLVVIAGNMVQAFCSTGPPPYMGQGDPVRFSFNPAHWVWSTEEYSPPPLQSIKWRGRWAIDPPTLAGVATDPAGGPFADLPALAVKQQKPLALPLRGTVTDLAHDPVSDRFLVTTQAGVYILDAALDRVLRSTIVDPGYSVDLGRFAGGAFLDKQTIIAVGENKSYVVLRENDKADAAKNFRYFLESRDKFDEVSRGRFGTVRARMMYTMSVAFDPATNSLYTVTVPNAQVKRLVLSRFDGKDLTLSEEYMPVVAPGLTLKKDRTVDQLYVTGAAVADGKLYAISVGASTLLTVDLATRTIVAAHAIPGLTRPVGIAVRGDDLYIAGEGGQVVIVARPAPPEPQPVAPPSPAR
jgi:disulfide bond formation protein DsbB